MITFIVDVSGGEKHFLLTWAALGLPLAALFFVISGSDMIHNEDWNVIKAARDRVTGFARDHMGSTNALATLNLMLTDDLLEYSPASRPLLFRLDAVMIHLDDALQEIGPHETAIGEAREIAARSVTTILERNAEDLARRHADKDVMTRLRQSCQTAVDGRVGDAGNIAPTAPTARIARIVDAAERVLAAHPDIVDDQGARVDDLIRRHVPRLLQRHAEAARTAPIKDVAEVDIALDHGVEDVRRSVEEALERVHDEAMDALSDELRFLSLRRGITPQLTSVG